MGARTPPPSRCPSTGPPSGPPLYPPPSAFSVGAERGRDPAPAGRRSHGPPVHFSLQSSPGREAAPHRPFPERSRSGGRPAGPVEGWPRRQGGVVRTLVTRSCAVAPAIHASRPGPAPLPLPPLVAPTPFVGLKTPVPVAVPRGLGRRPKQRLGGGESGRGARPEGRRFAATPPSSRHLALGPRNLALSPGVALGLGRARSAGAGRLRPSLSARAGVGGAAPRSAAGGRPRLPRVPGTISSREAAGHRARPTCDQVRAGEAGGGAAAPRAYSRG